MTTTLCEKCFTAHAEHECYAGERTEDGPVVNVLEAFTLAGKVAEDVNPTIFWGM